MSLPRKARNRDLYLDALRTAAIVRVVTYHTFGGSWLSWVFPAMGMMFALAGGLMVRSLDKQPPLTVIRNRFRRLLPALWLFGLVMIPVMIWQGGAVSGWTDPNTGSPVPIWKLVFWVVPVLNPPGNEFGADATVVLWYLKTYLWLVALSPLLLKAFRKYPLPTLVAPLTIVVLQSFNVLPGPGAGEIWDLLSVLGMFAPCWMLGFAHRTGKLAKIPAPALLGIAAACGVAGAAWAFTHPVEGDPASTYDLNGIPLGDVLWSFAFILPLLRFAPDASWIGRTPFLGRFVALVNARAVTIYLWHNVMIDLSFPIDDWLAARVPALSNVVENQFWDFVVIWVLVAIAVVLFGWVEDFAARRKPRLFPVGPSAAERRAEYEAEKAEAAADAAGDRSEEPTAPVPVGSGSYAQPTMAGHDPYAAGHRYEEHTYGAPAGREQDPYAGRPYDDGGYGSPQPGAPGAPHRGAPHSGAPYDEAPYGGAQNDGGRYGDNRHRGVHHPDDRYPDDRYQNDRYPNDRYPDDRYGREAYGDPRNGGNAYTPGTYGREPYPPDPRRPEGRHSGGPDGRRDQGGAPRGGYDHPTQDYSASYRPHPDDPDQPNGTVYGERPRHAAPYDRETPPYRGQ
ncbi:acyltransferase family protein [Cryptosporangium sp. NPDC051539]|uniref:acyltransferase family protein n=1 Tax=Cryptosporangium sp. NPDC051539 TaxID=3363962 RepID=UPI00378EC5A9